MDNAHALQERVAAINAQSLSMQFLSDETVNPSDDLCNARRTESTQPYRRITREELAEVISHGYAFMQAARRCGDICLTRQVLALLCRLEILAETLEEAAARNVGDSHVA